MPSSLPSELAPLARLRLLVASYRRLTGKPLLDNLPQQDEALRRALWEAPRVIVVHGTEADPVFCYGNRMALQLFEMSFEDFVRLPSRYSAEAGAHESRAKLLEQVARQGYVAGYSGARIASSGRRFMISAATVWNLLDQHGNCHGQAATFADWQPL